MADPYVGATGSVGDRLLASSTRFARSAVTAYSDEEWDVFSLHLATAAGAAGSHVSLPRRGACFHGEQPRRAADQPACRP